MLTSLSLQLESGIFEVRGLFFPPISRPQTRLRWTRGGESTLLLSDRAAVGQPSPRPVLQCKLSSMVSSGSKDLHQDGYSSQEAGEMTMGHPCLDLLL